MPSGPSLRFDRAQYAADDAASTPVPCAFCGRALGNGRFEVLGQPACETCGHQALSHLPVDDRTRFLRSLGVGSVTALAGGLLLAAILFVLPPFNGRLWTAYFAALGIGWTVGRTMRAAAQGAGGRRYQVTASLLTYAAVILPPQFDVMGAHESAWWLYPLLLLRPFGFLFVGLASIGVWQLLAAGLGIRFAWTMLKPLPTLVRRVEP